MDAPQHNKFSVAELFSSPNGKTSMSLLAAFIMILTGCFGFAVGAISKNADILMNSTGFATLGSGLLGIRRFTQDKKLTSMSATDKKDDDGDVEAQQEK